MGARKVVLLREAVSAERAVKERVGCRTAGRLLRLAGGTVGRHEGGLVLLLVAGAALGRVHVDGRTLLHVLEMRFGAGVTRRAGEILVGGARMILGDVGVAGCALIVGRLGGSAREKTEKRKRGGDGGELFMHVVLL